MAILLKTPENVLISKEATLLALRICYGELVDTDLIGWIGSLKIENGHLRQLLNEICSIKFGLDGTVFPIVDTLRKHLEFMETQAPIDL